MKIYSAREVSYSKYNNTTSVNNRSGQGNQGKRQKQNGTTTEEQFQSKTDLGKNNDYNTAKQSSSSDLNNKSKDSYQTRDELIATYEKDKSLTAYKSEELRSTESEELSIQPISELDDGYIDEVVSLETSELSNDSPESSIDTSIKKTGYNMVQKAIDAYSRQMNIDETPVTSVFGTHFV